MFLCLRHPGTIDPRVLCNNDREYLNMCRKLERKSLVNKLLAFNFVGQHHQLSRLNQGRLFRVQSSTAAIQRLSIDAIQSDVVDDFVNFVDFESNYLTPTRTLREWVKFNATIMTLTRLCV
jgi:hypothetical protein